MTRISAAKIICIQNKLIKVNLHIKRLISTVVCKGHLDIFHQHTKYFALAT